MTAKEIEDKVLEKIPFVFRNNRGSFKVGKAYIRYGIPMPPAGRKERPTEKKGGDRIGFTEVVITPNMVGKKLPIFTNIEIKTEKDIILPGQIAWHNWVISKGGISQIWRDKKGEIEIIGGLL